jgi:hypothetical protein
MALTIDLKKELRRTNPDYVVYTPKSYDGSTFDTGNEHFLVFDGPDGSLMAIWTQSRFEGQPNQRIVFARSNDEGRTWTDPKTIIGAMPNQSGNMASWAFPMVSKTGRIYVLYNHHIGYNDLFTHTTGLMGGLYSDDAGKSWSGNQLIPMRRSKWDNPNPAIPANWIVWQKPERLSKGKYFVGFTRWISPPVRQKPPIDSWVAAESIVEFMRFENIDCDPQLEEIEISNYAFNDDAIRVPFPNHSNVSVAQEPSIVSLPDSRLFCIMRTSAGSPFYVISNNQGENWSKPQPLRYGDTGDIVPHPLSPCPIYSIKDGRYMFLFHNNDGHFEKWGPTDTDFHRRPLYVSTGHFKAEAMQPIWFSKPRFFMDNDGVFIGYGKGRCDLAMYSSVTRRNGKFTLWYPERKFFLLGRNINGKLIERCDVQDVKIL